MRRFHLKKWYFDLVTPGGDALYVYFIVFRFGGFGKGLVTAHLRLKEGRDFRAAEFTPPAVPDDAGALRLGRHHFSGNGNGMNLLLRFRDATISLRCATQIGRWRPTQDGDLWRNKRGFLSWEVAQASTQVRGTAEWGRAMIGLSGRGYQDIVETTIPPSALPISELIWGRAHCGDHVVVFNQARTRENGLSQSLLVRRIPPSAGQNVDFPETEDIFAVGNRDPEDGQKFSLVRDEADRETVLSRPEFALVLNRLSVLEKSPVVTAERFKPQLLRSVLKRRCGDPHELKMVSRADLEIAGRHFQGLALHERVTWSWREKESPC
jgi:hypothetical protein